MDQTPFFRELGKAVASRGGLFNAHLHLDRAGTLEIVAAKSSLSLASKHGLIPAIFTRARSTSPKN